MPEGKLEGSIGSIRDRCRVTLLFVPLGQNRQTRIKRCLSLSGKTFKPKRGSVVKSELNLELDFVVEQNQD